MSSSWSLALLAAGLYQCRQCKVFSTATTAVVCYCIADESFTCAELLTACNTAVDISISYTSLHTKCVLKARLCCITSPPPSMTLVQRDASSSYVPLFTLQQGQHTSVMGKWLGLDWGYGAAPVCPVECEIPWFCSVRVAVDFLAIHTDWFWAGDVIGKHWCRRNRNRPAFVKVHMFFH